MIIVFMQVDFYQFSISWSRILPIGLVNVKNPAGIDYYNQLINELLQNNIQPMVSPIYQRWFLSVAIIKMAVHFSSFLATSRFLFLLKFQFRHLVFKQ